MTYKSAQVYTGSEWVDLAVSVADPNQRQPETISGTSHTLVAGNAGKALVFTNTNPISLAIPADSTYDFTVGQTFLLIQNNTGVITVSGAMGVTLNSKSSYVKTAGQYSEARLIKLGANTWLLSGDLSA